MASAGFESVGMAGYTSPHTCSKPMTVVRPDGVNPHSPAQGFQTMHGTTDPMSESIATGEEFRNDTRTRRTLPPETLRALTRLDPVRSTLSVLTTLTVIATTIAAALTWWAPWTVIPAVIVIATQQHACFVLAHDAAHYRLYRTRWLNDLVGRGVAIAAGISMCTYRVVHRLHHNHLYEPRDPDIALHGGYPRGRIYLLRKLGRDLAGLTAPKTYAYFFGAPAINHETGVAARPLDDTAPKLKRDARRDRWLVAAFHAGALAVAFAFGLGVEYLVLWVLPAVTVLQAILRLRAVCEHGAVTDLGSPLTAARTNHAPWWARWLLFPHHVSYHVEHHLYPAIPHYNLPACHRELRARGMLDGAEVRPWLDTMGLVVADRRPG